MFDSLKKSTVPGPAALAAANWWGGKLGLALTNGTDDGMSAVLQLYAQSLRPAPSASAAEKFIRILAEKVQPELERMTALNPRYDVILDVDYGPNPLLADAAKEAGVRSCFPIKTTMWVHTEFVTASLGYQGGTGLVWASDKWLATRPTCSSQKWIDSGTYDRSYKGEPFACSLPLYHDERKHQFDRAISLCRTCGADEAFAGVHKDGGWQSHEFDGAPAGESVRASSPDA